MNDLKKNTNSDPNNKVNKLLIVGAFPPEGTRIYGGIISSCAELLKSSIHEHFDLILLDSTQKTNPPPSLILRLWYAILRFFKFIIIISFKKPDAILLFSSSGASIVEKGCMAFVSHLFSVPSFVFPRGCELISELESRPIFRYFVIRLIKFATCFLCQGPVWQKFAINICGFSEESSPIIYNWTATDEMLAIGKSFHERSKNKKPCVLYLGWLEESKGIFELLEATKLITKQHDFTLKIAGSGNAYKNIISFVNAHNLDNVVEMYGWVDNKLKKELLEMADIIVLPSWHEGFPNSIIEGMASRLAVVVTKVGNIPDVLYDREQALLVPPKDIYALKSALVNLIVDEEFRNVISERGYLFAKENFALEKQISKLVASIKKVINPPKTE